MDEAMLAALLQRVSKLEREAVRYRQGEVTDDQPLSVALGGSDIAYAGVRTVAPGLQIGDVVSVLVFGSDMIVLGRVSDNDAEWTNVSGFTNSWVNFDGTRVARYRRHDGVVYLDGVIKSGTINQPAFTLPVGYRPATGNLDFIVDSNATEGIVTVATNGQVTPAAGSNAYFFLQQISFRVA